MSVKKDLTQGDVRKQLITFVLPFMLTYFLQGIYNLAGTLVVSYFLSYKAVSAIDSGCQILNMMINVSMGLTVGGTVVIGKLYGAKDSENLSRAIGTFLSMIAFLSIAVSLLIIIFAGPLLVMINTPAEVLNDAELFLRIYGVGIIFLFGYNAIVGVLRGIGNSLIPMFFVVCSTVLNIGLDLLFVAVLKKGVWSVAVSTSFSIFVSFALSVWYLYTQRKSLGIKRSYFHIDKEMLLKIVKIGLPSAVQSFVFSFSFLLIISFINKYGVIASAAVGYGSKIDFFAFMPLNALSAATGAVVAQCHGAGNSERIKTCMRYSVLYHFISAVLVFSVIQLIPTQLIRLVTPDPEVMEMGVLYLRCTSFNFLFVSLLFAYNSLASGSGHTLYCLCTTIMNAFVFRVPIALFLGDVLGYGITGVFLGLGFANMGGSVAGFVYYKSGFWKRATNKSRAQKT